MIEYTLSEDPICDAAELLADTIKTHIDADERIVLLLSGGSGVHVGIETLRLLKEKDLSKVFITLTDERYGDVSHKDENWKQLQDAGMDLRDAMGYRVLTGKDPHATAQDFANALESHITAADFSIGIFGIGPDGHTAGIKPASVATAATGWATYYKGEDFERITMTFDAIRELDEVVIQASGADKVTALRTLLNDVIPTADQPAQVLKEVSKATLFTDFKEEA